MEDDAASRPAEQLHKVKLHDHSGVRTAGGRAKAMDRGSDPAVESADVGLRPPSAGGFSGAAATTDGAASREQQSRRSRPRREAARCSVHAAFVRGDALRRSRVCYTGRARSGARSVRSAEISSASMHRDKRPASCKREFPCLLASSILDRDPHATRKSRASNPGDRAIRMMLQDCQEETGARARSRKPR